MGNKVKIRTLSNWSIGITIALAALCVAISIFGFEKYRILRSAMDDHISCERAVQLLQQGSDALTKQVRFAAVTGEQRYIDAYFEEANVTKTREKALDALAELGGDSEAMASLEKALAASIGLMQTEYYSMRLVEEAIGADEAVWPEELKAVTLTPEDEVLSTPDQLRKAQKLVVSVAYEDVKIAISDEIDAALDELTEELGTRQAQAANTFTAVFRGIVLCSLLLAGMMLFTCLFMRTWIVKLLISYNDSIQHGEISPIYGAGELANLANTYNRVYRENEDRELLLRQEAERDPLTGLLNRGSFDRLLSLYEKNRSDFALILIDVDTFKSVNDTYGHAVGDAILKKVASLLLTAFRTIDYVCRIGGDEFAVIMVDMTSDLSYTIVDKISEVNRQLVLAEENIPSVSLSVGVAFADRGDPGESIFKDADSALYYTKERGRKGYSFYPV